ncbi:hypothetical protein RI129_003225 [Pyrocoelia pectoralis]|uniref:Calcineurin-like phosphoesterase domain-containing protein n=1 Tax=Pyrocoelia pectoralis TaxID=417401 RepID=A0AAN7VPZ0_9COLE
MEIMVRLRTVLFLCFKNVFKHLFSKTNNRHPTIYFIYAIFLIIFIIEIVTYYCMVFFWHQIECHNRNECTKLLLVADPQLIGLHNEQIPQLTSIAIWDSDRYLSKTFWLAYKFVDPDVVIFLGDLLDEGSSANDKEFNLYVNRFYKIFQKQENTLHIWIAGDNDIGGEYPDYITYHKVDRFSKAFLQPNVITYNDVRFFKANTFQYKVPILPEFENITNFNIVLSHVPLLSSLSSFVDKVLDAVNPNLIFTAHTHKSMVLTSRRRLRQSRVINTINPDSKVQVYNLNSDNLYEIIVPTCSYRMGTLNIGYGFAVLERESVHYTVLWSPSRFLQLIIYGGFCVILILYSLLYNCRKRTTNYATN